MAITGTEWLILGAIVCLAIMFKPNAVFDLARSLGKVIREFKAGGGGVRSNVTDAVFIETAKRLGIKTVGKDADKIGEEILVKASRHQH